MSLQWFGQLLRKYPLRITLSLVSWRSCTRSVGDCGLGGYSIREVEIFLFVEKRKHTPSQVYSLNHRHHAQTSLGKRAKRQEGGTEGVKE